MSYTEFTFHDIHDKIWVGFTLYNGNFICHDCFDKTRVFPDLGAQKVKNGRQGFTCCECKTFFTGLETFALLE